MNVATPEIKREATHLVVGFGITGLSMVKALRKLGVKTLWAIDSRETPPNHADIEAIADRVAVGGFDEAMLDQCDYLWISPGVPLATEALQNALARLPKEQTGGDIEIFARLIDDPIIGITGTNGKSTVTTMVGNIVKEAGRSLYMGGNLGEPALNLWMQYEEDQSVANVERPVFVLELSSFQLETTYSLQASVGIILNIAPDHLDRYPNFKAYQDTKLTLLDQSEISIVPSDCPAAIEYCEKAGLSYQTFSLEDSQSDYYADIARKVIIKRTQEMPIVGYGQSRLGGFHNILNMVSSVAICDALHLAHTAIERGLETYEPLPHRCVLAREKDGVRYYNDSKATNIPSTEAAISGFAEPKWLILGGVTKGQDFSTLTPELDDSIKKVYLIGTEISAIISHIPKEIPHEYVETLARAVEKIDQEATSGDVVLFSPACASFDQFKGFEARGDHFIELVNAL